MLDRKKFRDLRVASRGKGGMAWGYDECYDQTYAEVGLIACGALGGAGEYCEHLCDLGDGVCVPGGSDG